VLVVFGSTASTIDHSLLAYTLLVTLLDGREVPMLLLGLGLAVVV
jgi:hypothetical protein